jgi:hypothetical protein
MSQLGCTTFEDIESSAGRTYGIAVFITYATTGAKAIFAFVGIVYLAGRLRKLVRLISPRLIERLSKEEAEELSALIQKLHQQLITMLQIPKHGELEACEKIPLLRRSILSIKDSTEDLSDILDDLALSHDEEFKGLLSEAINDLKSKRHPLETMHN